MNELISKGVGSRQYAECTRRANMALTDEIITAEAVLFALQAIPTPRNTSRKAVMASDVEFVHSQAIGITTLRGAAKLTTPTLSNACKT